MEFERAIPKITRQAIGELYKTLFSMIGMLDKKLVMRAWKTLNRLWQRLEDEKGQNNVQNCSAVN